MTKRIVAPTYTVLVWIALIFALPTAALANTFPVPPHRVVPINNAPTTEPATPAEKTGDTFPSDKVKHFVAGAVIALVSGEVASAANLPHPKLWAFGAAVLAGVAKEAYDRHHGGKFDMNDLGATALGGAVVSFTMRF